jgi:hypothetical protein
MTGDIILQKRSGRFSWFISRLTGSDYVRCGIEMGDGLIAHVSWRGKRFSPISDWDETVRLRFIDELSDKALANIQFLINAFTVKGYDYFSSIKSWFWKSTDDDKYTGNYYHYAEFISAVFREGARIDLVPGRSDDTTRPQDFLTSSLLKIVPN